MTEKSDGGGKKTRELQRFFDLCTENQSEGQVILDAIRLIPIHEQKIQALESKQYVLDRIPEMIQEGIREEMSGLNAKIQQNTDLINARYDAIEDKLLPFLKVKNWYERLKTGFSVVGLLSLIIWLFSMDAQALAQAIPVVIKLLGGTL